jgi:hypothetical protein
VTNEIPKTKEELACYKIYSKILNKKLQKYSDKFTSEVQNGFGKGCSCPDATFCLKLLTEKGENII